MHMEYEAGKKVTQISVLGKHAGSLLFIIVTHKLKSLHMHTIIKSPANTNLILLSIIRACWLIKAP